MGITFGEAKRHISQFAGRGGKRPDAPGVDSFVKEVLDYMLISGHYGNLRTFTFSAVKGIFTAPYELNTILKVRVDNEIGSSWDRWFDWQDNAYGNLEGCLPANAVFEEPNSVPIVYDVPSQGANIGTLAMCEESEDSNIIVKGFDATGREIFSQHNGETISGEYLSVIKNQIRYTNVKFARITEVIKTKTNGYVQLVWVNPQTQERGFLSDYSPLEETPRYRRFKLNTRCAHFVKLSVLGRIRLKENYSDNDLIPFENLYSLSVAAQSINANYNNNPQDAQAKDVFLQQLIQRGNDIQRPQTGRPLEVFVPLSGGSIKGIIF